MSLACVFAVGLVAWAGKYVTSHTYGGP